MSEISAADRVAAVAAASSEIKFLFDREQVDPDFAANLFHAGITAVRQFAAFGTDIADIKDTLKT